MTVGTFKVGCCEHEWATPTGEEVKRRHIGVDTLKSEVCVFVRQKLKAGDLNGIVLERNSTCRSSVKNESLKAS